MLAKQVLVAAIVIVGLHSTYAGVFDCLRSPKAPENPFEHANEILACGTGEEGPDPNIAVAREVMKEPEKLDKNVKVLMEILTIFGDFRNTEAKCNAMNIDRISDISAMTRFVLINTRSNYSDIRESEGRVQRLMSQLYDESFKACVEFLSSRLMLPEPESDPELYTAMEVTRKFKQFVEDKDEFYLLSFRGGFLSRIFGLTNELLPGVGAGPSWLKVLLSMVDLYGREKLEQEVKNLSPQERNRRVVMRLVIFYMHHSCTILSGDFDILQSLRMVRYLSRGTEFHLLKENSAAEIAELRNLAGLVIGHDICIDNANRNPKVLVESIVKLAESHSIDLTV